MRKHETAVCGTARTVVWEVGKCENRRQMPFMISIYLLPVLQRKIKTKNIGDINYGNEGHFEQNVEPRGTFS